ncbi:MAG: hypothetical protein BWY79_01941 [Actinobacteria bacterium ADurb.Bin444]|nr:MAG: hypothetical protein BWY79_01941 [Actinobacteria bacterium ADurb.Bin444]
MRFDTASATALSTLPEAARVAMGPSAGVKAGSAERQAAEGLPLTYVSH